MFTSNYIHRVDQLIKKAIKLPETPGVYAFWWLGEKKELMEGNRKIVRAGPGGEEVTVEYRDWWPPELPYPCLYVGKSTNISNRIPAHMGNFLDGRFHNDLELDKANTLRTPSCQLRFRIEHVFPNEQNTLKIIREFVGFSYFLEDSVEERFFEEDRLIGTWRPWFNVDCER